MQRTSGIEIKNNQNTKKEQPEYKKRTKETQNKEQKKESLRYFCNQGSLNKKKAATYSPTLHCSTIGAGRLNVSVRNGKRWDPAAITT